MAEKLIVLSDGTGNSAAKFFKTNVWKVYEALNLSHEGQQIACYDDGVGTSKIKPLAILGGVFGYGLKRNVLNIYSFLSRHYAQGNTPEIYGFGFSRGAFTIRLVVGLIESQGLLPDLDDREMRRMAKLAYRSYRKERCHTLLGVEVPFRALRDAIVGVWHRVRKLPEYDSQKNVRNVAIRFLGLWDTVNAYGMPIQELRRAIDKFIFPMTFASRKLLGCCECARHALSIDDERSTFAPVLWDHDNDADLKQLWFCGSHSNVGGGYPDDRLASAPLAWIVKEAESAGLSFRPEALTRIRSAVTPYGRLYDSRSGFRAFYRYKPRQIECDLQKRVFPTVHESVLFRMATGFQGYAPIALPQKIQVIDKNGVSLFFEGFQKKIASEDLDAPSMAAFAPPDRPVAPLASLVAKLKAPDEASVEHIRAAILQRRLAYYGMLFTTLCLLIFPIIFSADQFEPSGATSIATLLSAPLKELELITPSYLSAWLESFVRSPVFAWSLIALAFGSYIWGTKLKTKIADLARAAWQMGDASQSKAKGKF